MSAVIVGSFLSRPALRFMSAYARVGLFSDEHVILATVERHIKDIAWGDANDASDTSRYVYTSILIE